MYAEDSEKIIELFNKYDQSGSSTSDKLKLFRHYWKCNEDYFGIMLIHNEQTVAYLGLIFCNREFNGETYKFCNLTSLIIDPAYRGQRLAYTFIQHVQNIGDYTITAITPISALYNMYAQNGFKALLDERKIFWRHPFVKIKGKIELLTDPHLILSHLDETNKRIYLDHKNFNCLHLILKNKNETCYIIIKKYQSQRRKFITNKWINYLDFGLRKISGLSFLNATMESHEIHYASNYNFLCENINSFAKMFFKKYNASTFSLRMEHFNTYNPKYLIKNNYNHSHQMYYSKNLQPHQYDTLYSEIFILDI